MQRFEQLLKLDLIELGEDYFSDKIYFEDPELLEEEFNNLEETNLKHINSIQEVES